MDGYNGADLKSLTRHAAMVPVRDSLRMVHSESDMECDGDSAKSTDAEAVLIAALRPVAKNDFLEALRVVKPTVHGGAEGHAKQMVQPKLEWG